MKSTLKIIMVYFLQTSMIIFNQRFHPAGDAERVITIKNQIKINR
jgi:hypothetical protein